MTTRFVITALLFSLPALAEPLQTKPLIEPGSAKTISLVVSSPRRGLNQGTFGHAALRISLKEQLRPVDILLEFVADLGDGKINIFKGMGIQDPYSSKVIVTSYLENMEYKTKVEFRNVDNYVLKLMPEQKDRFVQIVNEIHSGQRKLKDYKFFSNNCATMVSLVLQEVYGKDFDSISETIPVLLPKLMKKHRLIESQTTDLNAISRREKLLKKFLPDELVGRLQMQGYFFQNFRKHLASRAFRDRALAYLKLMYLYKQHLADTELAQKVRLLASQLLLTEPYFQGKHFLPLFSPDKAKTFSFVPNFKALTAIEQFAGESASLPSAESFQIAGFKLVPRNDRVSVRATLLHSEYLDVDVPLQFPEVRYDSKTGLVNYNDTPIFLVTDAGKGKPLSPNAEIYGEVVEVNLKPHLLIYFHVDHEKQFGQSRTLNKGQVIDFLNNKKRLQGHEGVCYTLVYLQKHLIDHAFFMKELPRISPPEYIRLLEDLLDNKIVVLPGVADVDELMAALDETQFTNFLVTHQEKAKARKGKLLLDHYKRRKLNRKTIDELVRMTNVGLAIPVALTITIPGNVMPVKHIVLVTRVDEEEKIYRLWAYDPNVGYKSLMTIDKKDFLFHTFYIGENAISRPFLDVLDLDYEKTTLALKSIELNKELLRYMTSTNQRYSFSLGDFLSFLK